MSLRILLAALILLVFMPISSQAGKLYKWVDSEGRTHYSDKVPPNDIKQARSALDEHGVTIDRVDAAKTPEQIRQEEEEARLREAQERLAEKQRAEDRVLLRTFRSEDDIIMTRNGQIQAIDTYIHVTEANIKRLKKTLEEMQANAAQLELSGQRVSKKYLAEIEEKRQALKEAYQSIVEREHEKNRIRQSFAKDQNRFRELKKLVQVNDPMLEASQSFTDALLNVYECGSDQVCEKPWQRAKAYLKQNSTTPVKMDGENIVLTSTPQENEDISITVSRIFDRKTNQTLIFMDLQCKETQLGSNLCSKGEEAIRIKHGFQAALGETPQTPNNSSGVEITAPRP